MALPRGKDTLADTTHTKPPGLKAIETHYNGYRFRSRLEARWAVFLDHLSIPYEYEAEGYELADGTRYLPDFYLPNEDTFLEIKGPEPTPEDEHKAGMLAHATNKFVNILHGTIGEHQLWVYRPRKPLVHDQAVIDWLAAAPVDQDVQIHLASGLVHYGQYHIPKELSREALPPLWDVQGRAPDTDSRFYLDYDEGARRLAIWSVRLNLAFGVHRDKKYDLTAYGDGVHPFRAVSAKTMNTPWAKQGERIAHNRVGNDIDLGGEYLAAVRAARSARFEYGQTPRP